MSGTEWRFTDEQGVERTLTTQELRASLASGKIAPSTLVWHAGMKEFAPAFTLPELSGAAIAAGRSSRASIPPTGGSSTSAPAAGSDARPRSVPPPVPKRVPSVAPPVPVGKPHRPPMRTLTGLEPPELLESLGLNAASAGGIHDEATRDVTADDEDWDDATDVIPLAPKVPKEAANLPRSVRRIPSIPPPPLPANPTPPPAGVAPAPEAPRRPTLMGLAQRKPSKPPPRRSATPGKDTPAPPAVAGSGDQERTVVAPAATAIAAAASALPNAGAASAATTPSRSKPPPPLHRKKTDPTPAPPAASAKPAAPAATAGPKRLAKTLEIDTKLTEKALERPKPQPPSPPTKTDAPKAAAKQEIAPPPADKKADAAADKKTSAAPADAKAPKFAKDSNTGTITTIRKTAEGTVIMDRPAVKKSAEGTEIMAPRPADISSLDLDDKETAQPKRQHTLEMALEDHTTAAEKHPESPSSVAVAKGKGEDTGTAFQVDQEDQPTEEVRDSSSSTPPDGRRKKSALEVPLSSLIAASMVWIIGLLAFFFVGRISGFKSAGQAPVAKDGFDKFLTWTPGLDLGAGFVSGEPKPCSVTRQPKKWAPSASKSVPFDMRAEGEMALLGFAQGDHEGVGLKIDPKSGKFEETFRLKVDGEVVRVSPTGTSDGFFVGVKGEKTIVPASAKSPRFIVIENGAISAADAPDGGGSSPLWTLDGEGEISAEMVQRVNDDTFFLTFRRGNEVIGGYFGADKTARGSLVRVTGSGGKVGKPRSGANGSEVAVVFADKPSEKEDSNWEVRIGRAAIGQVPETTEEVSIPEGGPGGDAIAPDIIGLDDGRWLLMWTEGQSGERSILAQTYDKHFAPVGDPIALSPPAGSFGQAVLGVVGTYTTVAFLQAADEGFEMWGAVLQCGN